MQACHGQIQGAAIQALSQAMFEELRYDGPNPENATPRGYRVAQTCDLPADFQSIVFEHGLGRGVGKLKGIGEAGILGVAACIANAIEDCLRRAPDSPCRSPRKKSWQHWRPPYEDRRAQT